MRGYNGAFIARRLGVDDRNPTPAVSRQDGREFVPTRTPIVFAHHFVTIAGAGPLVGPTLALAFGWGPVWLWILCGCVLFGAVHDMTAMFVSMREGGRSIADIALKTLGRHGYFLLLAFLVIVLTLINAIFLNLSCKALTAAYPAALLKLEPTDTVLHLFVDSGGVLMGRIGGIATTSVLVITACAPLIGWLHYRRAVAITPLYILAILICAFSLLVGFQAPIILDEETWRYLMVLYVFIACWLPVWVVLQPRDFVNVQILYGGMLVMLAGLVYYGWSGREPLAAMTSLGEGAKWTGGPVWPFLLITVACGAISGFHSLAASGTTVKQISRESETRRVGYNAMALEGGLALMALLVVATALPRGEYREIVFPVGRDGNPILAFSMAMGYMLHDLTGIKVAFGAVLGILVLEGFVLTTLDTSVRLCRYMLEELWSFCLGARTPAWLKNTLFNTSIAIGLMLFFSLNSTIMSAWRIFGAGNQLIAVLALTVVAVWLLGKGRAVGFVLMPAGIMMVTTFTTLIIILRKNLAPAESGMLFKPGTASLAWASVLLLTLSSGVLVVAYRAMRRQRTASMKIG